MNKTLKKRLKIGVVALLSVLNIYLIYAVIMNLVVWSWQPRFQVENGGITSSLGFFVQFVVYTAILVMFLVTELFCVFYFFKPRKKK